MENNEEALLDVQMFPAIEWLAEQMPGGFFIYSADESQQIIYVNQAACRIFGCETEEEFRELTHDTFEGMVYPEDYEKIQSSIDEQIGDGDNLNMDFVVYRIVRKDGSVRWVEDYGHFASFPGVGDVYYVFIADVTEKYVAQEEKERSRMLALAVREAEKANNAKTEFLSNVSHEIRTPMNAILGLDHLALQNRNLPKETREQLLKIGESAKHMVSLIDEILDISRIETGKIILKEEEFSFRKMLDQINTMIEAECEEKGLAYEFQILGHTADFYIGDVMKIKQIMINILDNAVKFTPGSGTVTFTVEEESRYENQACLRFEIKDTGVGMDEEHLADLFEPFSSENEEENNPYGCVGLGLSITKNIVDLLSGTIEAVSKKGVGSKFTVRLTLQTSEHEETTYKENVKEQIKTILNEEQEKTGEGAKEALSLNGKRILLVEDAEINAEILRQILKLKGVDSVLAENGQKAVEMFLQSKEQDFDAILMDIRMPVMDGFKAAKEIRALDRLDAKTIPIIALSSDGYEEDIERSLEAGMNEHLVKPVEPEKLFETLMRLTVQDP